jgi:hypothetical protein
MREALEAADRGSFLEVVYGVWRAPDSRAWVDRRTIRALEDRGLLRPDGHRYIITPEGRAAIGQGDGGTDV